MKMKCVVVDDEPLARGVLEKYIEVVDYLELVAVVENPLELNALMDKTQIDLIFLDIEMPLMNGLDFLKIRANLPMVILTTAFPNYAIEGFQQGVIDYLLKPITFNWFFKAVSKAYEYYNLKNKGQGTALPEPEEAHFFIKCENRYQKIYANKILFVQALQNYVMIHTMTEKYMTLVPLKTVEENLDAAKFIKVHKSYLVHIDKINSIDSNALMIDEHTIPVGRSFRDHVMKVLLNEKLLMKK